MPEDTQTQPEVVESESQETQEQESFGIFEAEKAEEQPKKGTETEEPKQEPEKYEEVSKLTAQMLEYKSQLEEMKKLIEADRDEAVDDLGLLNEILGPTDTRTPEEKRVEQLEAQLRQYQQAHQRELEELKLAQQVSWATKEAESIDQVARTMEDDLPWVDVVKRVNPKYNDMVLFEKAERFRRGADVDYADIIKESNEQVRDQYMSMIDAVLEVPGAKKALFEKLGISLEDRAAPPPRTPSPTLDGGISAFSEKSVTEYEDDDAAFNAAVKLLKDGGWSNPDG